MKPQVVLLHHTLAPPSRGQGQKPTHTPLNGVCLTLTQVQAKQVSDLQPSKYERGTAD